MEKQPQKPLLLQMASAHILQMLWKSCFLVFHLLTAWNQLSTEACLNNSSQSLFSLKPVSAAFVHCQLRLLNTSTGTGLDRIPARLLKDAAPSISALLTAIINLSISSAVLPEEWKKAKVVPLYKDGDKKCMDNYRPISVLPVASKILERAVQIQLLQHLDKSSQLSPFQCGFRKNHSTQDAVTYFTDCIRKGIDKCCVTAAVFVDFRKAFNSVNHQLLLKKLPGYGIKNHELRWFKNYLTSRCHSVVYGSAKSAPQQIKCGLPQGPYFVRFCFRFTSMTCPTVYFRQRSYFMQTMLSFSTLTPISET